MVRDLLFRLRALFRRNSMEAELDRELRAHLDHQVEKHIQSGLSPEEAARRARLEFGGLEQVKEEVRDSWGVRLINELLQDLRYGLRQLRRNPGFTTVAILTLTLGIGANVAIFSVINAVMLRTLPVRNPEQLELLAWQGKFRGQSAVGQGFSYPEFKELRRRNQVFTGLMAFWSGFRGLVEAHLENPGFLPASKSLDVEMVSTNYFSLLGVNAVVGRTFTPDEDNDPGTHPVAVISYGLWTRLFARSSAVLGRKITIRHAPFTIVGVAPAHFTGVRSGRVCDVWVPVSMQPKVAKGLSLTSPTSSWLNVIGRLKPGVSLEQAHANLDLLYQQIQQQQNASRGSAQGHPGAFARHIVLLPAAHGTDYLRNKFKQPLLLLMGMVALVLLIACINVSNLLLAHASARQPEIAVRLALGAGRRRLVRQLLTESVLLALSGAALGVLFAYWLSPFLVLLMSQKSPLPGWDQVTLNVHPDLHVLIFTALVVLITGIAFGLVPALGATRMTLSPGPRHLTTSRPGRRLGRMLVVAQVALSLVMVIGAGLLVRTFHNLETFNPGFNRHNVLLFLLDPHKLGYKPEREAEIRHELFERLQQMPGVRSVSYSMVTPIGGGHSTGLATHVEGYTPSPGEDMQINTNLVGPHYFQTMSMAMVRGRDFGPQDQVGSTFAAVINQAMARRFFGSSNPIGKHFQPGRHGILNLRCEVVGVVKDARRTSLRDPASPAAYLYIPQFPRNLPLSVAYFATFEVRSTVPPMSLVPQVRRFLQKIDSRLAPTMVRTLEQQLGWSLYQERMMSVLSSCFGLLALLLACVGLYGTQSYAVARRTNEIGIRTALGAGRRDILRMVLGEALLLAAAGIAIGLPAAWAATRSIASRLYGLKPTDPLTILGATLLLAAVAVLAGYWPARRASRVDPMEALRYE